MDEDESLLQFAESVPDGLGHLLRKCVRMHESREGLTWDNMQFTGYISKWSIHVYGNGITVTMSRWSSPCVMPWTVCDSSICTYDSSPRGLKYAYSLQHHRIYSVRNTGESWRNLVCTALRKRMKRRWKWRVISILQTTNVVRDLFRTVLLYAM